MFQFPFGTMHQLNLDWFIQEWRNFKESLANAFTTSTTVTAAGTDPNVTVAYDPDTQIYNFDFEISTPVKPISFQIGYQSSSSGTVIPTGTPWLANPPAVAQGDYLWTRNMAVYNDGNYYATYSVSRMGVDGAGTGALYFTNVPVAAMTGDIATITDTDITTDHVLAEIEWANPTAITTNVTWTSNNGSLILNGSCSSATTANVTLIKKIN